MSSAESLIREYSAHHRNKQNQQIHKICVPLIMLATVSLFWSIPVPASFVDISPYLNCATILLVSILIYYFSLGLRYFFPMLGVATVIFSILAVMPIGWHLWAGLITFGLGWAGQLYGHKLEGAKPSFFTDLRFLLIGPLWVFSASSLKPENEL